MPETNLQIVSMYVALNRMPETQLERSCSSPKMGYTSQTQHKPSARHKKTLNYYLDTSLVQGLIRVEFQ
jgi:hypothetical protein